MKMKRPFVKKPFVQATDTPCLHCGAGENQLFCHGSARPDGTPFDLLYHVACKHCRANGPVASSAEEAIKAWGHRAAARAGTDCAPGGLLEDMGFEDEESNAA